MNDYNIDKRQIAAWEAEESGQQFPLLDYLQLLWFRKKMILAITLFITVVGYIQISEIKNVYSATSTMLVGMPEARVVDIEEVIRPSASRADAREEVALLRSRELAARVIDGLGLLNYPEFNPSLREPEDSFFDFLRYLDPRTWLPQSWKDSIKEALGMQTERAPPVAPGPQTAEEEIEHRKRVAATNIFLSKLRVINEEWSRIINITFSSLDPELATRIANDVPEAYIVANLEARFEATEKATAWLTEQLDELEEKVLESERAVEIYRDQHGLADGDGRSILDAQLSEINSQLIIARAERAEVEARLLQLRRLLAGGGQGIETSTEVLASTLVQQLRTQEAQSLSRKSELSVEYGPKHPRMLQVEAEIEEIRERIRDEVERIMVALENEVEFARTRVFSLETSLREARGQTSEQNKEAIQLRALQREASANRTLYETFLTRFKETSSTQELESTDARIISRAEVPGGPTYPNRRQLLLQYVLGGFVGACGLVLMLALMNPGMMSPEQVQRTIGEFVIGLIPNIEGKLAPHDYVLERPNSGLVEAINTLKFSLALSDPDHPVKAVQVTSSVPEEGKTTLALALARVVASSGQKVIIVDGDLRRSSIGRKLNIREKHKGLSDLVVASEETTLSEYLMRDEKGQIDFMPTGTAKYANATDIFSSHRMVSIIDRLKSEYDLVIVDTPPVMAVADARIIGRVVDKTLFVVRWDKTPRKVAKAAVEQLRRAEVDIAGVVLQQVDLNRYGRVGYGDSGYYYHYGRYGNYYAG
ncbi:MAG: polysaccharide biosynthesis tyrosine autokinase [Gammaproteobacteria bacterium]|nr:polysaccharide biosynthesis tyrosine autokinase [Gammaproteobacteria bacterium]